MTLMDTWNAQCFYIGGSDAIQKAGVQRIHRDIVLSFSPEVFFDDSMGLESTGYTNAKLTQLKNHYFNKARVQGKKYGSGVCDFRGKEKRNTKQDYCITAMYLSYYPAKKGIIIDIHWRTTEIIKRFRGDLVFFREFLLPKFEEIFLEAPILKINLHFNNVTFHPMFAILLINDGYITDWDNLRRQNYQTWLDCIQWAWKYILEPTGAVCKYSSAKQVLNIYKKITPIKKRLEFKKYLKDAIKKHYDDLPNSMKKGELK